jgi:GNAT superfamily N-acetyltransferase
VTEAPAAAGILERHARLLFDLDVDGRIVSINEPEPDPPPRFWLGRDGEETLLLARSDVPADLAAGVAHLVHGLPAWHGAPLATDWVARLEDAAGGEATVEGGPALRFGERSPVREVDGMILVDEATRPLLERHYPFTARHLDIRSPVVGVVRDGAIVAVCMTCRTRPDAGEVGVDTQEAYRGRGFARALVARWRTAMDAARRTPFYSTSWDNAASLAVARALRLQAFAEELSVS